MGRLTRLITVVVVALISAQSAADDDQSRALQLRQLGEILPLEEILAISRQQIDGHILEVELEQKRSRIIYEIEILDHQGRVWELKFDAANGDILERERE